MKKIFLATSFFGLISVLNAFDTNIFVGATAGKLDGHSYTQYSIGQNSNTRLTDKILFGFSNSLNYGSVNSKSVTTVDMDLKLGYEFIQNLRAYAIGTGAVQFYDSSTYTGLGYGGSLEYRLTQNVALEGTYKTMHMSKSNRSYDYDTTNLAVKFGF